MLWYYDCVSVVLQKVYSVVPVVFQWCSRGVTGVNNNNQHVRHTVSERCAVWARTQQIADRRDQRANSRKWAADERLQIADSRQQTAHSKQHKSGSRQETADSRQ
jgi:hypothetical protein